MTSRNHKSLFGTMSVVASAAALVIWIGVGSASPILFHATATPAISAANLNTPVSLNALGGQPPVATDDFYLTPTDQSLIVMDPGVLANDTDPEGDPITAHLGVGPLKGSLTLLSVGAFSYTPVAGFTGDDTFTYTASDGLSSSLVATVTITVGGSTTPVTTVPASTVPASTVPASTVPALNGGVLYVSNGCAGCHGATGGGGFGPALTTFSNAAFISGTINGVAGSAMRGYGSTNTVAEIQAMADFILGTTTPPPSSVPTSSVPTSSVPTSSVPTSSGIESTYGTFCASCHGVDGSGTAAGPSIAGEEVDEVMTVVRFGEGSMPAYPSSVINDTVLAELAGYVSDGLAAPEASPAPEASESEAAAPEASESEAAAPEASESEAAGPEAPAAAAEASESEAAAPETSPVSSPPAADPIYGTFCASCHGVDGSGTAAGPSIAGEDVDEVMTTVRFGDGSMPAYSSSVISNSDLADLANYVSGMSEPAASGSGGNHSSKVQSIEKAKTNNSDDD